MLLTYTTVSDTGARAAVVYSRLSPLLTPMSKLSIEEQLASIQQLRVSAESADANTVAAQLRPLLLQKNNLLVARSADLARELNLRVLVPELTQAFQRLLDAPEKDAAAKSEKAQKSKSDPQCWAKNALSKALHHLGCDDAGLYLQGMRTHQYEPVWGGQSDVAGTLRANCAHALVDCHQLTHHSILLHLLELVADEDKAVRAEVVRAIAAAGGDGASLLLRLRALTSTGEPPEARPEIMGHCYAGLLALEGVSAVPFVAQFLEAQDDCSAEAAFALGETRTVEALEALLNQVVVPRPHGRPRYFEPDFARALLTGVALTRHARAIDTLLELVATESNLAEAALEALAAASCGDDVKERLAGVIGRLENTRISRSYRSLFPG